MNPNGDNYPRFSSFSSPPPPQMWTITDSWTTRISSAWPSERPSLRERAPSSRTAWTTTRTSWPPCGRRSQTLPTRIGWVECNGSLNNWPLIVPILFYSATQDGKISNDEFKGAVAKTCVGKAYNDFPQVWNRSFRHGIRHVQSIIIASTDDTR